MLLRNRQGRESRRELRVQVLEVPGEGNRTLFVFDEPRDVAGTAFLVHAHRTHDDDDDQWIYLPALRRVKRISSGNRSGSFMGSEFSYEDMTPLEVEKFTYRYLRDEPCGQSICTVTERVPADRRSGYRRQIVWRGKDELRIWRIEYYDRRNAHLKTLTVSDYSHHLDRYWRPGDMTMANHLTGKTTVLTSVCSRNGATTAAATSRRRVARPMPSTTTRFWEPGSRSTTSRAPSSRPAWSPTSAGPHAHWRSSLPAASPTRREAVELCASRGRARTRRRHPLAVRALDLGGGQEGAARPAPPEPSAR